MKRANALLVEWGRFQEKTIDHADEYGDSILFRFGLYGAATSGGRPGHRILCADQPSKLQKIGIIVKRLPSQESDVLTAYYCAPLKECGNPYEKRDLAKIIGLTLTEFNRSLSRGRRMVEIELR